MHRTRPIALAATAVAALLLAGCSAASTGGTHSGPSGNPAPPAVTTGTTSAPAPAPGAIPIGPGPQARYTVQPQPAAGTCHYRADKGEPLEDPACTPGALNPAVTQATLATTICRSGYTASIRPPASITGAEKRANAASYGYTGALGDAEFDHLVSLELGGDPNDARNLWVEAPDPGHRAGGGVNNAKDPVESRLRSAVCSHRVTLAAAQTAIVADWTTALATLHLG